MKSILGIVKDIGPLNEMVHGADLKTINYKHFYNYKTKEIIWKKMLLKNIEYIYMKI